MRDSDRHVPYAMMKTVRDVSERSIGAPSVPNLNSQRGIVEKSCESVERTWRIMNAGAVVRQRSDTEVFFE